MKIQNLPFLGVLLCALFLRGFAQTTITPVIQGQKVTLTATADGTQPFTYVWKKGATVLPETGSTVVRTAAVSDSGDYTVTISNAFGSATSPAVTLSIGQPPTNPKISIVQQIIAWLKSIFTRGRA